MDAEPDFFAALKGLNEVKEEDEPIQGRLSMQEQEDMFMDRLAEAERRISGVQGPTQPLNESKEHSKLIAEAEMSRLNDIPLFDDERLDDDALLDKYLFASGSAAIGVEGQYVDGDDLVLDMGLDIDPDLGDLLTDDIDFGDAGKEKELDPRESIDFDKPSEDVKPNKPSIGSLSNSQVALKKAELQEKSAEIARERAAVTKK